MEVEEKYLHPYLIRKEDKIHKQLNSSEIVQILQFCGESKNLDK